MTPGQIIASLNALNVGAMDLIWSRLEEARDACMGLEQEQLARHLDEACDALRQADLKTYRKRVQTVISRLGHIK